MEKRFFLAIALSFIVLMAYSAVMPKPKPIEKQCVIGDSTPVSPAVLEQKEPHARGAKEVLDYPNLLAENNLVQIESADFSWKFSKKGAFLLEVQDKVHNSTIAIHETGLVPQWSEYNFNATRSNYFFFF